MFIEPIQAPQSTVFEAPFTLPKLAYEKPLVIKNAARASKQTLKRFQWENAYKIPPIPNPMAEKAKELYEHAIKMLIDGSGGRVFDQIPQVIIDQAIQEIDEAIELNPFYAGYFTLRGALKSYQMKFDEAVLDLDHAINLHPDFEDEYQKMGSNYVARAYLKGIITLRNLFGSSLEDLQQAAALGNEEAKEALAVIPHLAAVPLHILLNPNDFDYDDDFALQAK